MTYTVYYHSERTKGMRVFHTEGRANIFIAYLQNLGYIVDELYIAEG